MTLPVHKSGLAFLLLIPALAWMPVTPAERGCSPQAGNAADIPWSTRIGDSFLLRHPGGVTYDSAFPSRKWNYEQGLMLVALLRLREQSGASKYFDFVRSNIDLYVGEDGSIDTYDRTDYNLDNIAPGRALLTLYQATKLPRYMAAADTLRRQLREQPRTREGGFWHKQIYPNQMWLDGLFMAEPFYARYAVLTGEDSALDDVVKQFLLMAKHAHDPETGLYYHAWDESRQQRWADPATGRSRIFWGRSIGWFAMGLVDVLDILPVGHPQRGELLATLQGLAESLLKYQDTGTGLWYQVVDQGKREGNYLESSASAMFAYCFARGVNQGYLGGNFGAAAERAFRGLVGSRVTVDGRGLLDLHGTCAGTGLGGTPYRDGSYEYYVGVARRTNDMKGLGPFLLAAIELERRK